MSRFRTIGKQVEKEVQQLYDAPIARRKSISVKERPVMSSEDVLRVMIQKATTQYSPDIEEIEQAPHRPSKQEYEFNIRLIHRLLLRNQTPQEIAKQLNLSNATVNKYIKRINEKLRENAKNLDINILIGDTISFYKELEAITMIAATDEDLPVDERLSAVKTAILAKDGHSKFLEKTGVFETLRFQSATSNTDDSLVKLVEITEALLSEKNLINKPKMEIDDFELPDFEVDL